MSLYLGTTAFRFADIDDAEFILSLRTAAHLNKYLSPTEADLEIQKQWLSDYKSRERDNKEYYFMIFRIDKNIDVGTVRLYDFNDERKSFCWGSWILNENKSKFSAVQSAFLVYQFAFDTLGFERSHFQVNKDNVAVVNFHKKFGATVVRESETEFFFNIEKVEVMRTRSRLSGFIE